MQTAAMCVYAGLLLSLCIPTQAQPATTGCTESAREADLSFSLFDPSGKPLRLDEHRGRVILLDFWATWCAPCRIEIPGFVELFDKYRDQGLSVIGVSVDDPADAIQRFAEQFSMNYPVVMGDGRDDLKTAYGPLHGFPTTFLISRDGRICHQHTGFAPKDQFEREIRALL